MRIIYVGALQQWSTSFARMRALEELGHHVEGVDTCPPSVKKAERKILYRIRTKLFRMGWNAFGPEDLANANSIILNFMNTREWDILWIDKGLTISPDILQQVKVIQPGCMIIGYSPDDMAARHNQSQQFLQSLDQYDIFFTTKSYGVSELLDMGCKRVEFIGNAFDPHTHKPIQTNEAERNTLGGLVGFIGAWEPERADSMFFLAKNDIPVRIWGTGWERCRLRHHNLVLEKRPLRGEAYAKAICSFDVNLCFLRKINRDLQTTRSIEIPACGGFMLAERTDEHLALFEEDKEAGFFGCNEELLNKTKYYLSHSAERRAIAKAGRNRCLSQGYSNHDRLKTMLNLVYKSSDYH